jgi:hypothetical protein
MNCYGILHVVPSVFSSICSTLQRRIGVFSVRQELNLLNTSSALPRVAVAQSVPVSVPVPVPVSVPVSVSVPVHGPVPVRN